MCMPSRRYLPGSLCTTEAMMNVGIATGEKTGHPGRSVTAKLTRLPDSQTGQRITFMTQRQPALQYGVLSL